MIDRRQHYEYTSARHVHGVNVQATVSINTMATAFSIYLFFLCRFPLAKRTRNHSFQQNEFCWKLTFVHARKSLNFQMFRCVNYCYCCNKWADLPQFSDFLEEISSWLNTEFIHTNNYSAAMWMYDSKDPTRTDPAHL